jgi:hypothetical protein
MVGRTVYFIYVDDCGKPMLVVEIIDIIHLPKRSIKCMNNFQSSTTANITQLAQVTQVI